MKQTKHTRRAFNIAAVAGVAALAGAGGIAAVQAQQKVVKVGNTPRDVYRCSQRILDEGYSIQCPVIHGYSQVL